MLTHNKSRQVLKCKYENCDYQTKQMTQLNYHYRMKHLLDGNGGATSSKGYRCHFCQKVYSRGFKEQVNNTFLYGMSKVKPIENDCLTLTDYI